MCIYAPAQRDPASCPSCAPTRLSAADVRPCLSRVHATAQRALDALGFSWSAPASIEDPTCDLPAGESWASLCDRFAAYRAEHGDGQVPKKYQKDPVLGGWVAAVRRGREALGAARVAQLDALGFEWVSTRQCGSAFMQSFRQLRDFYDAHEHTDVAGVLGGASDLAHWCDAQRRAHARGLLLEKRVAYLDGICFDWRESDGSAVEANS